MKKMKLSSKAALSLALSAVLFCMPAAAFSMNGNYAMSVFAGETEQETETAKPEEDKKPEESTEQTPGENETEGSTEESTGDSTVSGMKHRSRYVAVRINAGRMIMIKTALSVRRIISSVLIKSRM